MASQKRKLQRQNGVKTNGEETVSHICREKKAFKNACTAVFALVVIATVAGLLSATFVNLWNVVVHIFSQ
jgi:hypothetical protein